jgi:hypothetical protein
LLLSWLRQLLQLRVLPGGLCLQFGLHCGMSFQLHLFGFCNWSEQGGKSYVRLRTQRAGLGSASKQFDRLKLKLLMMAPKLLMMAPTMSMMAPKLTMMAPKMMTMMMNHQLVPLWPH